MQHTKLRGAIIGCGAVANHAHLPSWRRIKKAEIVAVCDPNEEAAISTSRRWGIPKIYNDFSRMVNDEKLDFVDICTSPITHSQLATRAAEAGLHVLVEKPMALNVNEAEDMIASSRRNNKKLCVVHNTLFSPVIQQVKTLVDNSAIGDLLHIDIQFLSISKRHLSEQDHWCHDPSLPGGLFNEIAPHPAYLALAFLGNISSVQATARKYSHYPWAGNDELKVLLTGENGLGAFATSYNSSVDAIVLNLYGTKGFFHVDHITQILIHRWPRSNKFHGFIADRLDFILPVLTAAVYSTLYRLGGRVRNRNGHMTIIQKFAECLQNNTEPPVTGEDGRETVRLLDEIWKQLKRSSM